MTNQEHPIQKLNTPKGNSYWNHTGVYQKEYEQLYTLVPDMGEADTVHGELIRCVGKLYYDYCNNGNCNAIGHESETETHTCYVCNGSGEEEVDVEDSEDGETEEIACGNCCGSGEVEEEVTGNAKITPFFQEMLDFLREKLADKSVVENVEKFMLDNSRGYSRYTFDADEKNVYDQLVDEVIFYCLTTPNINR